MKLLDIIYSKAPRARWLSKQITGMLPPGSMILNVGAGQGHLEKELLNSGIIVTSIEPKGKAFDGNIIQSSFEDAVIDHKFDAIVFSYSLHHLDDPISGIKKALSLLAPQGILLLLEIAPRTAFWKILTFDSRIACPYRKHTWTKHMLEETVRRSGGKIEHILWYRRSAPLFIIRHA